jgi:hypothetical protein
MNATDLASSAFSSFPVLEPLEPRLAPAGLIAVSVNAAGTLILGTVAGQDGDEGVTIARLGDGSYQLTPDASVTLRIGGEDFTTAQTLFGVTGLTANLGAGNDKIVINDGFFTKAVTVNLGAGNNTFSMAGTTLGATLAVTTGDGADTISFGGIVNAIGGAATLKLGGGGDLVLSSSNRMGFGGGLTVDAGAGNDTVWLGFSDTDDVRVIGNLKITGGAGNDSLNLGTTNATCSITGSLMMSDTEGNDAVTIAGTRFDAGAMQLLMGNGNNSLTTTVGEIFLARSLKWTSGTGDDNVAVGGTTLRIGTTVDIAVGSGGGEVALEPDDMFFSGGTVKMSSTGADMAEERALKIRTNDMYIGGKLTISGGAGEGTFELFSNFSVYLGGGAAFTCGAGDTTLAVASNGTLVSNGALSMVHNSGNGMSYLHTGSSADSVIKGSLTMKGGDEFSIWMGAVVTGAAVIATAPAPVDAPDLEIIGTGVNGLTFGSTLKVTMSSAAAGTGACLFSELTFEGAATFLGGAGADTFTGQDLLALKTFSVSGGAGADTIAIQTAAVADSSTFLGAVTLLGGAGADVFQISRNDAAGAIDFRNAVTVDGGTESDTLTLGSQAEFATAFPLKEKNMP